LIFVLIFKEIHPICATSGIWISHVRWTANDKLNLAFILLNDWLNYIKNEMNSFLCGDPSDKRKNRDSIV